MGFPWRNSAYPEGTQFLYPQYSGQNGWYQCTYIPNITYAQRDGKTLDIQLILPQGINDEPVIVYVQGSGWAEQNVYMAIPQLSYVAAQGFAVASVRFRDTSVATFPANVEDVKSAIRFLRSQAETYGYSNRRFGIWGGSSGGHTAAMVGLTPGEYRLDDYPEYDDSVMAVADFYGPADLLHMNDYPGVDHMAADSPESMLVGGPLLENRELAELASPVNHVKPNESMPAFLIVHGDTDKKVNFGQSAALYRKLKEANADVILYAVKSGDHGYMCPQTLQLVCDFMRTFLRPERDQTNIW